MDRVIFWFDSFFFFVQIEPLSVQLKSLSILVFKRTVSIKKNQNKSFKMVYGSPHIWTCREIAKFGAWQLLN